MARLRWAVLLVLALGCNAAVRAQMRQIDPAKLPPDPAVQHAYQDLLPIENFARIWAEKWPYPVPKAEVVARFVQALHVLETAQKQSPQYKELRLLTGLVAHLTYNLDVEEAYTPALTLLKAAAAETPRDGRAAWFLGAHQCQSNDPLGGMTQFLAAEHAFASAAAEFWQDDFFCANASMMPAHALRAYDLAKALGDEPVGFAPIADGLRRRLAPSAPDRKYPSREVWLAAKTGNIVRFTSMLCGESFTARSDSPIQIADVDKGTCTVIITPGEYPTRHGKSLPSLLVMEQIAKPGQTLEDFARGFLSNPKYGSAKPITTLPCPVLSCLGFEIVTDAMYPKEGGGHLLALAFASEAPEYPGLALETPQPLPKVDSKTGMQFFRPQEVPARFGGRLYCFVALDANQDIYDRSRRDFQELVKSMVIDTK